MNNDAPALTRAAWRARLAELQPAARRALAARLSPGRTGPQLVAYVVSRPGAEATAAQLREHLAARLPEHMVPAHIVPLDALPLTPNGKLDRAALPDPGQQRTAQRLANGGAYGAVAPRNAIEQIIIAAWSRALGVDAIAVHDDFFELGGDSLIAMRVVSRLREAFGVALPVSVLADAPTVEQLAVRVAALQMAARADTAGAEDGEREEFQL